jgi:type I restriction enzyme, S subunit
VSGFIFKPLGNLCEVNIGRTPSRSRQDYWGQGSEWLSIADMNQGRYLSTTKEQITDLAVRETNIRTAPAGTILLSFKLSIGKVGVAQKSLFTNEAIAALPIRDKTALLPEFLYWALQAIDLTAGQDRAAMGLTLNKAKLLELQIPVPRLPEQRRIATILDQAETLRTQRHTALALLDTLTQSIFFEMFGDPVTNPKGWPRLTLNELMEDDGPQNGLYKPSTDYGTGTPILRIDAFYDGVVTKLNSLKRVRVSDDEVTLFGLRTDDIVINRVNSIEYLGKSALIPILSEPTVFESNMMRFSVRRAHIEPGYAVQFLQTKFIKNQILSGSKNAVNQSSINQQDVKSFRINIPPLPLQQTFATRIAAIEALKSTHRAALAQLDALFASLQHRAFSGELTRPVAAVAQVLPTQQRSFTDLLQLDPEKGLEALIYVGKRTPQQNFYKALKTLYFADKHHLGHHGCLIYGETYSAMPLGPVPQAAYDAAKLLIGEAMFSPFNDALLRAALRRTDKQLIALRDADFSKLSAAERASLDYAIRYCADMSFAEVKAASHDSAYDKTPKNTAMAMQDLIASLPQKAQQQFFSDYV